MNKHLTIVLCCLWVLVSCRQPEQITRPTDTQITHPDAQTGTIKGFFLLNEGNMGSNKCTLDYFDYATGVYTKNIYAERNPGVVKELGDVGNDLKIYGHRLYAVINCSHFVEVMSATTAQHIGQISIPNCRYIAFKDQYAYVSSYAGPVQIDPNARLGYVAKIDTATLQVVGECTVGYQPEELVVVGNKLYVANSGGYRVPNYDKTVSVIDLNTFTETNKIEVAINLHRLELDRYGQLWVSSRGDYYGTPSKTFVIDTRTDKLTHTLDLPNSNMTRRGDSLYVQSTEWNYATGSNTVTYAIVDTRTKTVVEGNLIKDGSEKNIKIPYGIAVNPTTNDILVTDAKDYVTPGTLYCFSGDGVKKWSVTTGDIPAHIAFTTQQLKPISSQPELPESKQSAHITRVLDFMPAAGQFTNRLPTYQNGDTQQTMNQKVLAAIGNNARGIISLGGFGGYVVVGFDHTIPNIEGKRDFRVLGNAFYATDNPDPSAPLGGSCEPGVIQVAYDANKNGVPDPDEWFEIAGSAHRNPTGEPWIEKAKAKGNDVRLLPNYQVTYHHSTPIRWTDNHGQSGQMANAQFPLWASGDQLTFQGTRLPQNGIDESGEGNYHVLYKFGYGYADNAMNTDIDSAIDIGWAVDRQGQKVHLPGVDFIKIYSAVHQQNGWLGECSTEVAGVDDLHMLATQ